MEIGRDIIGSLRERLGSGGTPASEPLLDWHGLHARLAAAHAARRVFAVPGVTGGSFLLDAAETLDHVPNPSRAVNPNVSADGKAPACIAADDADDTALGDRG